MLVEIKKHCSRLVEILSSPELRCFIEESMILSDPKLIHYWENTAEWLLLAAAIKNVEVDIIQFEDGFGWCGSADEYSVSREELMNGFISELSRFNFVWGGLESCLNHIKPPNHPDKLKRGKIGNACYYIQKYFEIKPIPMFLCEEVSAFRLAASLCWGYASVENRFNRSEGAGTGLFAVYELRNLFAHGSICFPAPDEENQPVSDHQNMVYHATRIVLLSIQMLLLTYFKHSNLEISYFLNQKLNEEAVPLWIALRYRSPKRAAPCS